MQKPRDFDRQEAKLLQCLEKDPRNLEYFLRLGKLYFLKADYDRAAGVYNQGLSIEPENIKLLFNLAVTKEAAKQIESAKEIYLKILALAPNHQPAQARLEKLTLF